MRFKAKQSHWSEQEMALDSVRKGSHLSPLCMCVGVFVSAAGKKTSRNKKSKRNMLLIFFDLFLQFFICILCFCRTHRKTHKRLKLPITRHTLTQGRAGQGRQIDWVPHRASWQSQGPFLPPRLSHSPSRCSIGSVAVQWLSAWLHCHAHPAACPCPCPRPQAREQHSLLPGSCFVDWHTHTHTHPDSGAYGVTCQCWH